MNLRIENNIAILEFDQPDSKVNILTSESMGELSRVIQKFSGKAPSVQALIITSKKPGIFIAGADIKEIERISTVKEAREKAEAGQRIFNELSKLNLVTVAVINGVCLGGGFELALACKYRVASFSDRVKIGLPEVNLGVIPGFGGTQRLPRLVGLTRGLNMILGGKIISAKDAFKYGIVDRVFPENILLSETIDFVQGLLDDSIKLKKKKEKLSQVLLEETSLGRCIVFHQAKKTVIKKTKGFYPAPLRAIDVIRKTYGKDIGKGLRIESREFAKLAITGISKNLIKAFYLNEEFKKLPWGDPDLKPAVINKCGVIGAGLMGGGIAQLITYHDVPVRIRDINYDALKTALKTAVKVFKGAVKRRKIKRRHAEYKFGLISPTITYNGFKNTDIVIEAVVEDLNIKTKVFKELSDITKPGTILASNTSSLPIIDISSKVASPERAVGLHFFNPVHRMPLMEIIRSEKTSDKTLATAIAFARRMGKLVIVVKDVPGFLINRILLSYLNEAGFLIEEGCRIEAVDKIARGFGMPMGPLELIDEIGIDVGYKVAKVLEDSYGVRMKVCSVLGKVKEQGLLGKKTKRGFYIYKGKKKVPNSGVYNIVRNFPKRAVSRDDLLKRMVYVMVNEAAHCLEEGVADRPHTIDVGMIMGIGFPPFRAGLLRYADSIGIEDILKDLERFQKDINSERFRSCKYLVNKARNKEKFYEPF